MVVDFVRGSVVLILKVLFDGGYVIKMSRSGRVVRCVI